MMKRLTWGALRLGAIICLLMTALPLMAKEVVLEEVSISLYNKPVTGFRLTLDRSERFVANQIIDHVGASGDASPFQYERSIIYENIRYEPIVTDRDISLYYQLKSIQGQYTELTMVAMYDYRRAISSREFPELTIKLKIDLAKLVRHITGDVMQSGDIVYDDATLAKFEADPHPVNNNNPDPQPMADHFKREEVDNPGTLLQKDPFKTADPANIEDTAVRRLTVRVQQLEAREQELMATERNLRNEQATLERKQEVLMAKVKDNKALKDSIVLLNQRVEALISQAYVADDVSVSNETAAEIAALEKENARYKRQFTLLNAENDSLRKVAVAYGEQLNRLSAGGKSAAEQLAELRTENKSLQKQVEALQARESLSGGGTQAANVADSLLGLLAQAQIQNEALRNENEGQDRNLGRLKKENDELTGKKMQLEERMASLESENRTLREGNAEVLAHMPDENLIDSLNGEIRTARRSAGISKAEAQQVRTDMEALQREKDAQERQLVAAQTEQKNLQARIESLLAAQRESGNPTHNAGTSTQASDSLLLLRQQLKKAEALAASAEESRDALTRTQTQLQTRERELTMAQSKLQEKTTELAEALKAKAAIQKSLADANARLADSQNAKGSSQQEIDRLTQENRNLSANLSTKDAQLGKTTAENKTLSDSIAAVRSQRASLRKDIEARDRTLRQQIVQRDSLQNQLGMASNREKDLRRSVAALESRVDSLARVRVPEGEQARYLKEQRAKLDQLQKDLDSRDVAATDKEKLLSQRESVLQRRESEFAAQEDRFKDLEERERRLQMLEQQLNAREGLGSVDASPVQVREGRVVEFGSQVPVFIVESPLGIKAIQRQVVGYMLSREELLDSQFPEVLYRTAHLGELDSDPVELKIRIDNKANGTILQISMRLSNGDYLGGEGYRDRNDAAKQLISKMLRYKI